MLDLLICRNRSTTAVNVLAIAVQWKAAQSQILSADSVSELYAAEVGGSVATRSWRQRCRRPVTAFGPVVARVAGLGPQPGPRAGMDRKRNRRGPAGRGFRVKGAVSVSTAPP